MRLPHACRLQLPIQAGRSPASPCSEWIPCVKVSKIRTLPQAKKSFLTSQCPQIRTVSESAGASEDTGRLARSCETLTSESNSLRSHPNLSGSCAAPRACQSMGHKYSTTHHRRPIMYKKTGPPTSSREEIGTNLHPRKRLTPTSWCLISALAVNGFRLTVEPWLCWLPSFR